jgi:hypothetical protein
MTEELTTERERIIKDHNLSDKQVNHLIECYGHDWWTFERVKTVKDENNTKYYKMGVWTDDWTLFKETTTLKVDIDKSGFINSINPPIEIKNLLSINNFIDGLYNSVIRMDIKNKHGKIIGEVIDYHDDSIFMEVDLKYVKGLKQDGYSISGKIGDD